MHVMTLDVRRTHENNPECPARIVQKPDGGWMCVDCGLDILFTRINTELDREVAEYETIEDILDGPLSEAGKKTPLYVSPRLDEVYGVNARFSVELEEEVPDKRCVDIPGEEEDDG